MISSLEKRDVVLCFLQVCDICPGMFTLPLGVIGRLCSVIVALSGHLYYFADFKSQKVHFGIIWP